MNSIAAGKVEGWPQDLYTTYVASHFDDAEDGDASVVDVTANDPELVVRGVTRDDVIAILKSIFFSDEKMAGPPRALSGGWRMKLALCRGVLMRPDVFLLD